MRVLQPAQMAFTVPLNPGKGLNERFSHWRQRDRKVRAQRTAVHLLWPRPFQVYPWVWPVEVTLTRVYPARCRQLDDDNLSAALKAIRDQVAVELGAASDSAYQRQVRFAVAQERGPAWGVRIEVREVAS